MLCSDGLEIVWIHSRATVTTITSDTALAILDGAPVERWVAIAELTDGQFNSLFAQGPARESAKVYRSYGRRLRQIGVETYASQVTNSAALIKLFGRFKAKTYQRSWTRKDFLKELMKLV